MERFRLRVASVDRIGLQHTFTVTNSPLLLLKRTPAYLSIRLTPPLTARIADVQRAAVSGVVDEHRGRNQKEHLCEGSNPLRKRLAPVTDRGGPIWRHSTQLNPQLTKNGRNRTGASDRRAQVMAQGPPAGILSIAVARAERF